MVNNLFYSTIYKNTLVPEAIYGGSEERSEGEEKSPLVESVGNLTSMLSLDDD